MDAAIHHMLMMANEAQIDVLDHNMMHNVQCLNFGTTTCFWLQHFTSSQVPYSVSTILEYTMQFLTQPWSAPAVFNAICSVEMDVEDMKCQEKKTPEPVHRTPKNGHYEHYLNPEGGVSPVPNRTANADVIAIHEPP